MKNALVTMTVTLLLGCAVLPTFAEAGPKDQNGSSRDLVSQTDNLTAANQPQDIKEWTEPVSTTVTVSSTPREETAQVKQHRSEPSSTRPSKNDWVRCVRSDKCRPQNLFNNNKWDWVFGPADDFNK